MFPAVPEQPEIHLDEQALHALAQLTADGTTPIAVISQALVILEMFERILGANPRLAALVRRWISDDPCASEIRLHLLTRHDSNKRKYAA